MILRDLRLDQKMIIRIAIEVLTKSSLVVLNDPFISFTPSMTMNVLNYLKKAQRSGVIILLFFTQPRSMVLKFIQNVLLFGPQANILYSGTIANAERYFSQFELPNRHDYSDSDYLLDIVPPLDCFHSQISRADDIQMERIISAFRNSEEWGYVDSVICSNKLLLESLRQTRHDSRLNLQSPSFSRVSESFDGASAPALFRPTSVQRFAPVLETIEDQPGHPSDESSNARTLRSQSPRTRMRKTGSTARVPHEESLSSMTSVYGSTTDVKVEGKPTAFPKRAMSASFASPNRSSVPQSRSVSVSNVAQEEQWHVNSRLKLRLLFRRIMHCFYRDPLFLMGHTVTSVLFALSTGVFFWHLPRDSEGVSQRLNLLLLIVFYVVVLSSTSRIWYKQDRPIFIRDARSGYISTTTYFLVVAVSDLVINRLLPSVVFVRVSGVCEAGGTGRADDGSLQRRSLV